MLTLQETSTEESQRQKKKIICLTEFSLSDQFVGGIIIIKKKKISEHKIKKHFL